MTSNNLIRINTNFSQTLPKTDEETLSHSFYEVIITLIPKSDKDISRKKNLQTKICFEYRYKNIE